jgi:hypothetical protein
MIRTKAQHLSVRTGIHLTQLEVVAKQIPTPSEARQEIYGESGVTWGSRPNIAESSAANTDAG